jgi:hypothetical protein
MKNCYLWDFIDQCLLGNKAAVFHNKILHNVSEWMLHQTTERFRENNVLKREIKNDYLKMTRSKTTIPPCRLFSRAE